MAGLLPGLFSPQIKDVRQEGIDEESRLARLAQDPFSAAAYTAYSGSRLAGQGLARAAGSAMGYDTRSPTERNLAAVEAVKKQVAQMGFDPSDPKSLDQFYMNVVKILQSQGLVAEAAEVAKEWRAAKQSDTTNALKIREQERKEKKDEATEAYQKDRLEILRQRGVPEYQKYVELIEQTTDPVTRKMYLDRLNMMAGKAKGIKFEDAGDRVIVRDAATNEVLSVDQKGAVPMNEKDKAKADEKESKNTNAYRNAKAGMQQQYDAAVDLYNMPGFDRIFGRAGQFIGKEGFAGTAATLLSSDEARAAYEKWKQVTGTTFLTGLAQLKQASPTGSTGLGAVSNTEGDKVQAAGAALGRSQDPASARTQLRVYIQTLVTASENIDAAARAEGITPGPLVQKPLTGPQRGRTTTAAPQAPATPPAAPAAPAAVPAAPAAPSGASAVEFVRDVNGKIVRKQ